MPSGFQCLSRRERDSSRRYRRQHPILSYCFNASVGVRGIQAAIFVVAANPTRRFQCLSRRERDSSHLCEKHGMEQSSFNASVGVRGIQAPLRRPAPLPCRKFQCLSRRERDSSFVRHRPSFPRIKNTPGGVFSNNVRGSCSSVS